MRKKAIVYLLAGIVFLVGIYFSDKAIRCSKNGFTRSDVIKIANEKLEIDFNAYFLLKDEQFDNDDKSWNFTYSVEDCVVNVIIDRCGVSDVGGITEGCFPLQQGK